MSFRQSSYTLLLKQKHTKFQYIYIYNMPLTQNQYTIHIYISIYNPQENNVIIK